MTFRSQKQKRVSIEFDHELDMCEQAHKDECDMHVILRKQKKTGILNHTNQYAGTYGDFSSAPEYQEAQNLIADAASMFETVPAFIRAQFNNDAMQFVEFMQNNKNIEDIEAMGLDSSHLTPPKPLQEDLKTTEGQTKPKPQKPREDAIEGT